LPAHVPANLPSFLISNFIAIPAKASASKPIAKRIIYMRKCFK
jgi:hypothetical protein